MIGILNIERQRHSTPTAWLLLLWLTTLLQIQQAACLTIPESIRARRHYFPLAPDWRGSLNQKETTPESSGADADASTNVRAATTSDDAGNLSARDTLFPEINPNELYKPAPRPIGKTGPQMAVGTPKGAPSPSYPFPPYKGPGSKPSPASSQSHPPKGYNQQPPRPKGDPNPKSKPFGDFPPSGGAGGAGGDLFSTPITSDTSLPGCLQTQPDHPVPRKGIKQSEGSIPTNKFYANFFLGSQSSSVWTHPYSLQWPKGQGDSGAWGLAVSQVDASQRFFGDEDPSGSGAKRWFGSPVGRADVVLSEEELEKGNATGGVELTTQDLKEHSVRMQLSSGGEVKLEAPVVQGMGMVTALYKQGTPVIKSGVGWSMITQAMGGAGKPGVVKYRLVLNDGATWLLYATGGDVSAIKRGELGGLDLDVQGNNTAVAKGSFTGMLQLAKLPGGGNGTEGASDAEKLFDAACGTYATGVELSGSVDGDKGRYTFHFQKEGMASNSSLVMFALPHHQASFSSETAAKVVSSVKLDTTTKGTAVAVVGDEWTMEEDVTKPLSIGFVPWTPEAGSVKDISDTAKEYIKNVAQQELFGTWQGLSMLNQTDQPSMYYGGKALAKFASILVAVNDVLGDTDLAKKGLEQLKVAFARYAENQQKYPLVYDRRLFWSRSARIMY